MPVCNVIRDLMPLYADSAISADSRRAVREHLRRCPQCRAYFAELRSLRRKKELSAPPAMSPKASYPILAKRMRAHRRRIALIGGGALAVSLLGNLAAICLHSRAKNSHSTLSGQENEHQ
jgi:anti-sigma factor RsiW